MTTFETLSLISSVAIGVGQIGIIWYGIRAMNRSSEERARDRARREAWEKQREAWEQQRVDQEDRRHAEAMQAIDKRHEEAMQSQDKQHQEAMQSQDKRHQEAMQAIDRRHEEAMQSLAVQRLALEALIARTAPPAPAADD